MHDLIIFAGKNELTCLPPSIAHLTNLEELQIGSNRIRYLPSEILSLPLKKIGLHPNPWLKSPSSQPSSSNPRLLAPLQSKYVVPSLTELCLRVLLSKAPPKPNTTPGKGKPKTVVEAFVELPLSRWELPDRYLAVLEASISDSQHNSSEDTGIGQSRKEYDAMLDARSSSCANQQLHLGKSSCFYEPAEMRYEWVKKINGKDAGGDIPVEWRGCSRGCLEFLDEPNMGDDDDIVFGED